MDSAADVNEQMPEYCLGPSSTRDNQKLLTLKTQKPVN